MQAYTAALGRDLCGMGIGLLWEGFGREGVEPDVDAAVRSAIDTLGTLGTTITEVSIPRPSHGWLYCLGPVCRRHDGLVAQ